MSKSYEERMAEKYNFLKKDKNTSSEVTNKNTEQDEQVSNDEVIDVEGQEDSLLVPLDAWNTVLNQLGNLHEASQQMAEARERAAKAEAEAEFLREKLKNTREQLDQVNKKKRFFYRLCFQPPTSCFTNKIIRMKFWVQVPGKSAKSITIIRPFSIFLALLFL